MANLTPTTPSMTEILGDPIAPGRKAAGRALIWGASLLLGLVILGARPARAQDEDAGPGTSASPYFQVLSATEPGVDALPLKDTQVDVAIAGVIAEVTVVQTYTNEGTIPLEARYIFPGSTRAAVHGLTMVVGDRVVRAGDARCVTGATRRGVSALGRRGFLHEGLVDSSVV